MPTSASIRDALVNTVQLDIVGPGQGHPLEAEQLWENEPPSRWYLTGFLVPTTALEHLRFDPESAEGVDAVVAGEDGTGDDDVTPDAAPARRIYLPSSIGMSVLVPPGTKALEVEVLWGDYRKTVVEVVVDGEARQRKVWQRKQRTEKMPVALPKSRLSPVEVTNSRRVMLYVSARDVSERVGRLAGLAKGTRAVSVFVVNERDPEEEERADEANVYQVELRLRLAEGFVARPNDRGLDDKDADERIADLQYRDAYEFAVGHGVATHAVADGPVCRSSPGGFDRSSGRGNRRRRSTSILGRWTGGMNPPVFTRSASSSMTRTRS
jgi:hypothetical protein